MLRDLGYHTRWYGKWHLTHGDNRWGAALGARMLERHGFAGGTYPSPDGAPAQASRGAGAVAGQFDRWLSPAGGGQPWCTTVSSVNRPATPGWTGWSDRAASEADAPRVVDALPPNYETPEGMLAARKPRLQRSLQETAASSFGPVPLRGRGVASAWLPFLNLYLKLQREVDRHVGRVLEALES